MYPKFKFSARYKYFRDTIASLSFKKHFLLNNSSIKKRLIISFIYCVQNCYILELQNCQPGKSKYVGTRDQLRKLQLTLKHLSVDNECKMPNIMVNPKFCAPEGKSSRTTGERTAVKSQSCIIKKQKMTAHVYIPGIVNTKTATAVLACL